MNKNEFNAFQPAGSLFMVGLPGTDLDESTKELIADYGIHNFIIFRRNVRDRGQLAGLCRDLRQFCIENDLPAPIIAVDHEGGSVCRLPESFTVLPSAREMGDSADPEAMIRKYAAVSARELKEVGINMNLAPVLDVCPAGEGYFMESRSLGGDPPRVAELGSLIVRESRKRGLAACGKHFPGLGSAVLDPHRYLPVIYRSRESIQNEDLLPFRKAADNGLSAFMTSHVLYKDLDPGKPATLSPFIVNDLLRDFLGYQGMVISDDLEMGAIEEGQTVAVASVEALKAGIDLLLICHDHDKVRASYKAVVRDSDLILGDKIQNSLQRQRKLFADLL
ncbi:MAG: beta-N-acetylhexosaminidase [Desulfurivibrionaceae bacterium]